MSLRTFFETMLSIFKPLGSSLAVLLILVVRRVMRIDKRIFSDYQSRFQVMKLHIGCGEHLLPGWLNSDYDLRSKSIFQLNATWKFPFPDNLFDHVFSEHMIEHITYPQSQHMLSECFRVLKPNGKLRIATPDLAFVTGIYHEEKSALQEKYIAWYFENFIKVDSLHQVPFVVNAFMRFFGHQFIYDEPTLRESFARAGFVNITRYNVGDSGDNQFVGLENESWRPPGFLKLESLVLEGTKPQ